MALHKNTIIHIGCFVCVIFEYRAYKEEVALQNQNIHNVSYRIVPITMELRPKQKENGFLSGFLVDPNDVRKHNYTNV